MTQAIGMYHAGCFYSQSVFGVPHEHGLYSPRGVGRTNDFGVPGPVPGGPELTKRLIVLLHETSHYLHDLSLGACMACDYAHDLSSGSLTRALRVASRQGTRLYAPLMSRRRAGRPVVAVGLDGLIEEMGSYETFVANVLGLPEGLAQYCEEREAFRSVHESIPDLTGESILEGLVAAKTAVNLADRIEGSDDAEYLERTKGVLPLFPEHLPPAYNTARRVYDAVLGRLLNPYAWTLEEIWPRRYHGSPRSLSDLGFMYLADIALHIPPMHDMSSRVRGGLNTWQDFWPAFRFCKALDSLARRGGFPPEDPGKSPEFFYITLFNHIALDPQVGWPTFEETNDQWKAFLWHQKKTRREAADGYRYRCVVERERKPDTVVVRDPIAVCLSQGAPIMHLTPAGFKLIRSMQTTGTLYTIPMEWPDMSVREMFKWKTSPWEDQPDEATIDQWKEVSKREWDHATSLHQEVIYRSLCTELRSSVLYKGGFSCPFAPTGCAPGSTPCSDVKRLDGTSDEDCCIRAYLAQDGVDPSCVVWDQDSAHREGCHEKAQ